MPFNIMDLFGPGAMNRLLQPAQQQGVQNFLANPGAAQPEFFDPGRLGGGQGQVERPPAVGMEGLLARLLGPIQAKGTAHANAGGVGQAAQVSAAVDPWLGKREGDVVPADQWANMRQPQVDQMQTGAVAQGQPVQQQMQPGRSMGQGYQDFVNSERGATLNDMFTGWAMGSTAGDSIAKGAQLVAANRGTRKNVNQTVEWLKGKGMDEQQAKMLAASPPALNEYLKTMAEGSDPMKALQLQKAQLEVENLRNPNAKLTESERAFQQAKLDGFKGSRMEYDITMKEAGRNKIDINTGVKLPSGYEWLDPNDQSKGVKPIAGGPAEQIPGELAARVGMGENFLKNDLPVLREPANLEAATGPIDRIQAWAGYGKPAEIERKFQSGVEVLSRLLSGAGMTQVEIDEKTKRYMPTFADGPESLKTKLNQLEAEIQAAGNAAMRGRGGNILSQQPSGGVVDYQEYFKGP